MIDGVPGRLNLAKQRGADEVIDIDEAAAGPTASRKATGLAGGGARTPSAEFVGIPQAIPQGLDTPRAGGGTSRWATSRSKTTDDRPLDPRLAEQEDIVATSCTTR